MQTLKMQKENQEAHFLTSPRGNNYAMESGLDGPEPFRPINMDHI